jgi:hypothetical protein
LESVLAGGNGGIQSRPEGGGAPSSAGGRLAAATAERHWFLTVMVSIFCFNSASYSFVFVFTFSPFFVNFLFRSVVNIPALIFLRIVLLKMMCTSFYMPHPHPNLA